MFEPETITSQILHNCDISDSRYAGFYSVCGLALRLRDLFKWENGLDPWEEKDSSDVLEWIGQKEEKWNELAEESEESYVEISVPEGNYDAFDTRGINKVLEPHGLFYGAGYAHSLKPTFFLADIEEKTQMEGHMVYVLGQERARDLLTLPALTQDNCIVLRKESAKLFIWDQILYIRKSGRAALRFALENCGLGEQSEVIRRSLDDVFAVQKETYIYHELGEIKDAVFDRDMWKEIIGSYPHTTVELLARAVKDILADTNEFGALRHMTKERRTASLAFYVAFLDGLPKELFPELATSFHEFAKTGDWQIIEQAVSAGYNTAKHHAEIIRSIFLKGKQENDREWVENEIKRIILPE